MIWAMDQQHALTSQQGRFLLWLAWNHQDKPIRHSWRFIAEALGVDHGNLIRDTKTLFQKGLVMHQARGKATGAFVLNLQIELGFNDDENVVVVSVNSDVDDDQTVVAMTPPTHDGSVVAMTPPTTPNCCRDDTKLLSLRHQTKRKKNKKAEQDENPDFSPYKSRLKKEAAFRLKFDTVVYDENAMQEAERAGWTYDLNNDEWSKRVDVSVAGNG